MSERRSFAAIAPRVAKPVDARNNALASVAACAARGSVVLIGEASHGTHDFYALRAALTQRLIEYLDGTDPAAAARARARYGCFEYFGDNPQGYGLAVTHGAESCEDEVVAQLVDLRQEALRLPLQAGEPANEAFFSAEQNARLVVNAERYYRAMYRGRESTWNLRDAHMAETLEALRERVPGAGEGIVVWAHNSHLGDARATEMSRRGEFNLGQLARERYGRAAFSIGFSTCEGTVTAASDWDAPMERKQVQPGLPGSYERLFHDSGADRFWIDLADRDVAGALGGPQLQRAIGVIYRPQTERWSHYFEVALPRQFDVMIHLDRTEALVPLDRSAGWDEGEPPETWPTAV